MKKKLLYALAVMLAMTLVISNPVGTAEASFDVEAESAILVDGDSGKILFAKDPDVALPPASMTKMMTEYLVLEAIDNDEVGWDTTTQVSDYAYRISADDSMSGVGLVQDKDYTVRELYEAMAINSDNATTIALAELIAGSEGEFVQRMNEKGEEMGLPEFEFVNSTGLDNKDLEDDHPEGTDPDGINQLSARSSALLAYHLVNDYPEALEISSIPETKFDDQTIRNWNYMLPHEAEYLEQFYYEGVDGLKTGFTELAQFSFTGTANRDEQRLITVVMRTESEEARFQETAKLLDHGFDDFERVELFPVGHQLENEETIPVSKGKNKEVPISINEGITIPVSSGEEDLYTLEYTLDEDKLNEDGELVAPIEEGEKVGTAELVYNGEEDDAGYIFGDAAIDVVTEQPVEKSNWFMLSLGAIGDFFANLFTAAVDWIKGLF